ncbi:DUF721 domain-containing protein [Streptomyces tanashiensis]|uniref:DUF721 domain-containing protein n=1 Tax=Streptomyces tanashiensis TaxID=67367 RepID=UPI0036EFE8D4
MPDGASRGKDDLARITLHHAIQAARFHRGKNVRRRSQPVPRRGKSRPVPVAVAMKELLEQRVDWSSPADNAPVWPWPVLAEILPENLTAVSFDSASGTLHLRAGSPAWATQARLLRDPIIRKVNEALGAPTVVKIAVTLPNPTRPARTPEPAWVPYAFTAPTRIRPDAHLADAARTQTDRAPREPSSAFPPRPDRRAEAQDRALAVHAEALARARGERQRLP